MNLRIIWAEVKKEFLDNVRNRWILAISFVFLALALLVSYLGGTILGGGIGFQKFKETTVSTIRLGELLVPIIGIMLGYATLAGEHEQGSLGLVLSTPITRGQLLLGKFLGLAAVLTVAVLVGLGIAGAVIAAFVGLEGVDSYLILLGGTILEGLAFISISLMLSSVAAKRSTALGGGVLLWFLFTLIYNLLVVGAYVATGGTLSLSYTTYNYPPWLWFLCLLNPDLSYAAFALIPTQQFTIGTFGALVMPDYVNLWTTGLSMVLWTIVPLVIAYWRLRRRDV